MCNTPNYQWKQWEKCKSVFIGVAIFRNMKKIQSVPTTKATQGYVDNMINSVWFDTVWWIKHFSIVITNQAVKENLQTQAFKVHILSITTMFRCSKYSTCTASSCAVNVGNISMFTTTTYVSLEPGVEVGKRSASSTVSSQRKLPGGKLATSLFLLV